MRHIYSMEISLGTRLMLLRRESGLRQEDLADISGVSQAYIAKIERGRVTNVGIEYIFALAKALDVRVEHLLGLSDVVVDEGDVGHLLDAPAGYITNLTEEEVEAVRLLRSMSDVDRKQAMGVLRRLGSPSQLVTEIQQVLAALRAEIGAEQTAAVLDRLLGEAEARVAAAAGEELAKNGE